MTGERFPNWEINVEEGTVWSLINSKFLGKQNKSGYLRVSYRINKNKTKGIFIHILIWMVANGCDVPDGYDVHHIDGNKLNNSIYNLELVEHKKHMSEHNKGRIFSKEHRRKLSKANVNNPKKSKKVAQYTLDGELVKVWESTAECGRNGFNCGNISSCCNSKLKKYKGFKWKYT